MEEKIRQYVNYQFRFDKREDIDDLKEEIIGNLIDRYEDYVKNGKSPDDAYVEAIKSMGDFTESKVNQIPEEYSVKPSIPDILLMSGAILSIFGLLLTFFNGVVGTIVTAISILTFSGSAYYLYSYSQYVRKEKMDIEKHNLLLQKIFKYMKTSFIFWAISLSFIMASLVMNLITRMVLLDPTSISFKSLGDYIAAYVVIFLISLFAFLLIFVSIYNRLMNRYYLLTGSKNLKGKIKESMEFLYGKKSPSIFTTIFTSKLFIPIVGIIMILPTLFFSFSYAKPIGIHYHYEKRNIFLEILISPPHILMVIIPIVALIAMIILMILDFTKVLKKQWPLVLSYYVYFIGVILVYPINDGFDFAQDMSSAVGPYALIMLIILSILLLARKLMKGNEIQ